MFLSKLFTSKITLVLSFLLLAAGLIAGITLIRYPQILFPEAAEVQCPGPSPFMVYCTWDPVEGAVSYGVQVDEPSTPYPPSDPIYTTNSYFSFEASAGHTYVCYVHAVNDCGNQSVVAESIPWSCTASCPVVPTPNNLQVQTYTTSGLHYATFSWNPDDISNRYILEVARSDQTLHDSCPNKQTTTCIDIHTLDKSTYCSSGRCSYDTLRVTNLESGQYHWRVWAAKDIAGRSEACFGGPTNGSNFSVSAPAPTPVPPTPTPGQPKECNCRPVQAGPPWPAGTTWGCRKLADCDPNNTGEFCLNCEGFDDYEFNCCLPKLAATPEAPSPTPACPATCTTANGDADCQIYDYCDGECVGLGTTGTCDYSGYDGAPTGDLTSDSYVDGADASVLVANWGIPFGFDAKVDLNKDGKVNALDASILMSNWKPR